MKIKDIRNIAVGDFREHETCDLYIESLFFEWLKTAPKNVIDNYSEFNVDLAGQRVTITFTTKDK